MNCNLPFSKMVLPVMIILSILHVSFGVKEEKFYAGELCDLEERMARQCSASVANAHTMNECVFKCSLDFACIGASMDDHEKCFHHYTCVDILECWTKEETHKYKSKHCAHDGVWNPRTSTCSCVGGWIGKKCLDLPAKCQDFGSGDYLIRTHLNLSPGRLPIPVVCLLSMYEWTGVVVFQNVGGDHFNRTWNEYRQGFYTDIDHFWVGLDNWHALSQAGLTKLTTFIDFGNTARTYLNLRVADESHDFAFTFVSSYLVWLEAPEIISFGECLEPLQRRPFSTKDKGDAEDCASKMGSGWWYDTENCLTAACNFLGRSPEFWEDIPEYQRMRVKGMEPSQILNHVSEYIGVLGCLQRP